MRRGREVVVQTGPEGVRLAVTGEVAKAHTTELLDPSTGISKHSLHTGHQRAEEHIAFSADGRRC